MAKMKQVRITKKREVITYTELWHSSRCLLRKGQQEAEGSFHQFMASIVFTAFALEAYLNHIGPKLFKMWLPLERLSPKEKLDVIAEKIGLEVDYGKRPWGIMKELFGFRNDIAHGKSVDVPEEFVVSVEQYEKHLHDFAQTRWEKFCTQANAEKAREDVEAMVQALHAAAGIRDDFPFVGGVQMSHASPADD